MCKLLKVSRSRYYSWCKNPVSQRANDDIIFTKKIKDIHLEGRGNYGARKIQQRLQQRGTIISRKRIGRLMKEGGLERKVKRKYKITTDSKHNLTISPNLLKRQFYVSQPNLVWTGDITYSIRSRPWFRIQAMSRLRRFCTGFSFCFFQVRYNEIIRSKN